MQKQTNANIVVITSLTILLIGSIIMGLLIAYFSNNPNLTASAPLCTDATIVATKNGSTVYSFVLPEDAISYANYQQQIKILTDDNFPNSYVRLKLSINNNENLTVLANDNWQKQADGYFYYNNSVNNNNELNFNINLNMPKLNEKTNILNIVLESYEADNNQILSCWAIKKTPAKTGAFLFVA